MCGHRLQCVCVGQAEGCLAEQQGGPPCGRNTLRRETADCRQGNNICGRVSFPERFYASGAQGRKVRIDIASNVIRNAEQEAGHIVIDAGATLGARDGSLIRAERVAAAGAESLILQQTIPQTAEIHAHLDRVIAERPRPVINEIDVGFDVTREDSGCRWLA